MPTVADIAQAIERYAPLRLQEEWDNCGLQTGSLSAGCTGAMLCVDCTEEVVREAAAAGCNLVVSHHPLIFHGLKRLTGVNPVQRAVMAAIKKNISVYSAHTSMDNAPGGVSARMARMLGLGDIRPLQPDSSVEGAGSGAIGRFEAPVDAEVLVSMIKAAFGSPVVRCSTARPAAISRVAMCSGAGAFMLPQAIEAGAQAFVTSDTRYHEFMDYGADILIADIGHFESEHCITSIFYDIIRENFPNFAVRHSMTGINPITYM